MVQALADCRLVIRSSSSVDVTGSSIKLFTKGSCPRKICGSVSTGGILLAFTANIRKVFVKCQGFYNRLGVFQIRIVN